MLLFGSLLILLAWLRAIERWARPQRLDDASPATEISRDSLMSPVREDSGNGLRCEVSTQK
jgi:hypothetical protein